MVHIPSQTITFNWGLAIMTAIAFVVFSLIFFALAHMTAVQEETRDLLLEIKEQ